MTRISTANAFDQSLYDLKMREKAWVNAGVQMTSGKRVNRPSDDPTAAARSERMQALQQRNEASLRGISASRNAMSLAEGALGHATDVMQSVREAVMQVGNGAFSNADRQSLAEALSQFRSELLSTANSTDGSGGHVFGGQGSATPPFLDTPSGVVFQGATGSNSVSGSQQLPIALDGRTTWLMAGTGNGVFETDFSSTNTGQAVIGVGSVHDPSAITGDDYEITFNAGGSYDVSRNGVLDPAGPFNHVSGQAIQIDGMTLTIQGQPDAGDTFQVRPSTNSLDIFSAIDRMLDVLNNPNHSEADARQAVNFGLRDVDSVLNRMLATRAEAGAILNRLEDTENQLKDQNLYARTAQSDAEDLDLVEAISNFQGQQAGYQAALQSYSMIQRMSLFQYLG